MECKIYFHIVRELRHCPVTYAKSQVYAYSAAVSQMALNNHIYQPYINGNARLVTLSAKMQFLNTKVFKNRLLFQERVPKRWALSCHYLTNPFCVQNPSLAHRAHRPIGQRPQMRSDQYLFVNIRKS